MGRDIFHYPGLLRAASNLPLNTTTTDWWSMLCHSHLWQAKNSKTSGKPQRLINATVPSATLAYHRQERSLQVLITVLLTIEFGFWESGLSPSHPKVHPDSWEVKQPKLISSITSLVCGAICDGGYACQQRNNILVGFLGFFQIKTGIFAQCEFQNKMLL